MRTRALIVTLVMAAFSVAAPLGVGAQDRDMTHWGIISNMIGKDITLQDGTKVRMHEGTIIEPVGAPLYPGMRVRVKGSYMSPNYLDAHIIDKVGARH